jgi:uncharacterized coiled-coil protein SlyX
MGPVKAGSSGSNHRYPVGTVIDSPQPGWDVIEKLANSITVLAARTANLEARVANIENSLTAINNRLVNYQAAIVGNQNAINQHAALINNMLGVNILGIPVFASGVYPTAQTAGPHSF